jgi:hypothetical protein
LYLFTNKCVIVGVLKVIPYGCKYEALLTFFTNLKNAKKKTHTPPRRDAGRLGWPLSRGVDLAK